MSRNAFQEISNHTLIGGAIRQMARNAGAPSQAALAITGAAASGQTFTIGGYVFELLEFTTAAGAAADDEFNNTTSPLVGVTLTAHGCAVGDYIMMDTEFMEVIKVTDANTVNLARGALGSTIAVHADAASAFKNDTPPTAGEFPVGLVNPAVAATVRSNIVLSVNVVGAKPATAANGVGDVVVFTDAEGKQLATSETMTNGLFINGAAMDAGTPEGEAKMAMQTRVIKAGETAAGIQFAFNFPVLNALVVVAGKLYDGGVAISGSIAQPNNSGAVDVADADVVTVVAFG